MSDEHPRINKFIAHATGLSRREADELTARGRVSINGSTATMGARVKPEDTVTLDDKPLEQQKNYTYLLLHKPVNYVCSRRRQGDTSTIYELLPKKYSLLKPVGRLDKDSSGLILLTDDGDFAHRMTHPKFIKTKIYEVELDKPLEPLHQQMISDYGVQLEDGISQFLVEKVEISDQKSELRPQNSELSESQKESKIQDPRSKIYIVTMQEGRNRQIRRTFAALGYTVTKLHRTNFGVYGLHDLKSGSFTSVTAR